VAAGFIAASVVTAAGSGAVAAASSGTHDPRPPNTHAWTIATAGLLAVELLAVAVRPATGTGEASLTIVFTGNGSGGAVSSDGHIDCAYSNGVIVTNRCTRAGYSLFTKVMLTVTANAGSALCDNDFVWAFVAMRRRSPPPAT
jgi:hypothetical protein